MATESTLKRVKEIIADNHGLKPADIRDTDELMDGLGLDSLDVIELSMEVEKAFNITVEDDDVEKMKTVVDVANYVDARTYNR